MKRFLLMCGIAGPLLFIAGDIAAALRQQGYSYVSQVVSELSAVGAPTRTFVMTVGALYAVLLFAFGIGVVKSADQSRPLRIAGIVLMADAVVGSLGAFVPMNPRGAERSLTDVLHLVYVAAIILLMMGYIAFGAAARGTAFRIYSIATIAAMLLCGSITAMYAQRIAARLPTPGVGLIERVSVYGPVVWVVVLAVALLRSDRMIRRR